MSIPTAGSRIGASVEQLVRKAQRTPPGVDRDSARTYDALSEIAGYLRSEGTSGSVSASEYPPEVLLPDRMPHRYVERTVRLLTTIRDLGVFFPVAYTWWRLSQVLPAYHGTPGDSFIGDWAAGAFPDGHNGVTHVERLGSTALVIAGIVFVIILLTLTAHAVEFWIDSVCDLSAERRRLVPLLAEASLAVSRPPNSAGPAIGVQDLAMLGRSFANSTGALETRLNQLGNEIHNSLESGPGSRFATSLDAWTAAAGALAEATRTLAVPAEALREFLGAQEQITGAQRDLNQHIRSLIAQLQDSTKAASEAAHLQRGVASDTAKAMLSLNDTLPHFENRLGTLDGMMQDLRTSTRAVPTTVPAAAGGYDSESRDGTSSGFGTGVDQGTDDGYGNPGLS